MKLQNCILFGSLLAILTFTSNAGVDFTEQDLKLVRSACLIGSSFDFVTEASGAISVKNTEGSGKLRITGKDLSVVDLPDEDKKKEFSEIRECIKDYLLKNTGESKPEDKPKNIDSVNFFGNTLSVGVINPPSDYPTFMMNGVDISRMFKSEEFYNGNHKYYNFKGLPKQLNIHVGDNRIIVKYSKFELTNAFRVTEHQLEEARNMAEMMERISMSEITKSKITNMVYVKGIASFYVINPPDGKAVFILNGKDISRDVKIDGSSSMVKSYSFAGLPNRFNLVEGKNELTVRYDNTTLKYSFDLLEGNLREAYRIYRY